MYKPKLGLITVSLPPEISTDPPEAIQIADALGERAEISFQKAGLDVVRIREQVQSEESSVVATKRLLEAGVDCIIYLVGSWIYVPIVITPTKDLKIPFILWAVPEMTLGSLVPSCITHGSLSSVRKGSGFWRCL